MKCAILFALFALAYSTPYYGRGGDVDIVRGGGIAISYPTGRRVVFTKTVTGGPNYIDVTVEGPNVPYKRYQIDTAQYVRGQDEALTGLLNQQIMDQIDEYRRNGDLDAAVSQAIRQLYVRQQGYYPQVGYGLQQEIYQGQPKVQIGGIVPVEQEREIELQSQIQQYPFNVYQKTTQYRTPLQQLQQLSYLRQAVQQQQYGPYTTTLPRQMEYLLQLQQEQTVLQQQIEQSTLRGQNNLAYVQYQQLQQLQEQEQQLREQIQQRQQGSGLYGVWNMIRQPYGYYPEQQQYILNQLQQVQPQQNILGQLLQQQSSQQYVLNQLRQQPQYILNQLQQEQVQQQQGIQQKEGILSGLQQGGQMQQQQILDQLQQQNILNKLQQQPYGLRQSVQGLYNLGQVGKLGQQYQQYQQQPRVGGVY